MSPNNQEPNAPPKKQEPNAMGRCVLPKDLMFSIFTHPWDSVATILRNKREGHGFVKVVAFDKNAKVWNTVHIIGPIELELYSFFKCFNSGKIIGGDFDKKLHVFDPQSGGVKVLEMGETGHPQMIILNVYEYNESLFFIEGMEPIEKKKEQVEEKKEADEVDPTADPDEEKKEPGEEKKEPEEE